MWAAQLLNCAESRPHWPAEADPWERPRLKHASPHPHPGHRLHTASVFEILEWLLGVWGVEGLGGLWGGGRVWQNPHSPSLALQEDMGRLTSSPQAVDLWAVGCSAPGSGRGCPASPQAWCLLEGWPAGVWEEENRIL